MRNKIVEYVKQYALITLSISIMSVGVYFFKFPNNFVFGGVTGMAALAAKLTPLSASAFSSAANMILLGVGLIFLGKKFAMTTGYATVVMSLELMALDFAIDELGLYLTTHADDQQALELYWSYIRLGQEGRKRYQEKCGPLMQTDITPGSYQWLNDPWPWDGKGN